ncbi:MHYT domain-containing protein [Variovorax paradoxus]|uniref:MHYT domain-containing protein n=1 Tax=Variovorax paradoxus TaxID=34073 RepID=UPI002480F39B|nr:MHYT domain-containing protein [Variovorax paradoxus]WGT64219.1 MHYT domain-containing protein [Variovorax paradoxus]
MTPLVVGQLLSPEYSLGLVALSFLISFAGSLVALICAGRMVGADGKPNLAVVACAAVALGGIGIWSMHFIGMLAYRLPVGISYNVPLTVVSLVAAILISGIALYLAGGRSKFSKPGWLAGSLLAGLGVCVMHYMGMFAMNMRASMDFDLNIVGLSVVIAITAAGAALWLAFNLRRLSHKIAAAAVMGVAVCTMHYVGMSAANMICIAAAPTDALAIGGSYMGLTVFGTAGAVLIFIYWVITGTSLDAPVAPRRVRTS